MVTSKTKDLVSISHKYSIVPAKLTILYKKGASMDEIYKDAIVPFPILMQMEKPDSSILSLVFRNESDSEIFLFLGNNISLSIIVHECVHIVSEIFNIMGAPKTEDTEEFFAYLMDYTFETVVDHCLEDLKIKVPLKSSKS